MRAFLLAVAGLLEGTLPVLADDDADIAAGRKFAEPIMGSVCEYKTDENGKPDGYNMVYHLTYRTKGQDQDSPDEKVTLIQLECGTGAYNYSSFYVIRDGEGRWRIVDFAEPVAEYDYTDENFSRLKAPPKVSGFVTDDVLVNSEYSEETKSIKSAYKWRGIGDASSGGEWQFIEGRFVLKRFWMDPTYQAPTGGDEDPDAPPGYIIYDATTSDKWAPSVPDTEER
jgi:hypothetical protein